MRLYIIRHGDPDYKNDTITELGHKQAVALAEWFNKIKLDEIYTSSMGRAKDTAKYTCERQNITPVVLPWTSENAAYVRQLTPENEISFQFSLEKGVEDLIDDRKDYAEYYSRLTEEMDAFLESYGYRRQGANYKITMPNEKHIAIFCHGGFGTALTAHLLGLPPAVGFSSMFMTTSSVTTFEFKDYNQNGFTRPRMIRFGETAHLQLKGFNSDLVTTCL